MSRLPRGAVAAAGSLAILGAGYVAATGLSSTAPVGVVAGLLAVVGLAVAAWLVRGDGEGGEGGEGDGVAPAPWSESGAIVPTAPERTPDDPELAGDRLSGLVERAGETARREGDVAAGLSDVRPVLRRTLTDALVRGGREPESVEAALADGSWTDDPTAAAVLDAGVSPPDRPLRARVEAWLFPERVLGRRTARAVQAVAEAADDALPAVVGQRAPRSVPVLQPTLEDRRRAVDGSLRPAVDPAAADRGPEPPDPDVTDADDGGDDGDGGEEPAGDGDGGGNGAGDVDDGGNGAGDGRSPGANSPNAGPSGIDDVTVARTLRFRGGVAATVLLAVAGLAARDGGLLLTAAIPLAYVGYGSLSGVTVPDGLVATRSVEPTPAPPGRPVRVRLTVTNESDRTLPDVRIVDGVPERLAVASGTPRAGATLGPGESCTVEYGVVARRGTHEFDPPRVRLRDAGASAAATATLGAGGADRLVCRLDADAPPIEDAGDGYVGTVGANRPGDGVEFHSTRQHRPGDPADRLDWRQYAKRGTLATVNYRRRVAATVVVVVDARRESRVVAGPGRPTAVELSAYAATWTVTDLLRSGHDVGVAVVGRQGPGPAGLHWLPPGGGPDQRSRALARLRAATGADSGTGGDGAGGDGNGEGTGTGRDGTRPGGGIRAGDGSRPGGGPRDSDVDARPDVDAQVRRVAELAPAGAQLALFSPVLDDGAADAVETWRALSFPGIVLSPDVLAGNTVGGQFAQVRRRARLARCQATGARTIDWRRGTPLALAVEYAFAADARLPDGTVGRSRDGTGGRSRGGTGGRSRGGTGGRSQDGTAAKPRDGAAGTGGEP